MRRKRNGNSALNRCGAIAALSLCLTLLGRAADFDREDIRLLIASYAKSIDLADTTLAEQIWSSAPEVSLIHPRGEEHGLAQIETDFYRNLMGATFSKRNLTPHNISIHVYGEAAWAEFNWDFVATTTKDGSPFHSQGRETQVYRKQNGQWRIVHVHYSGAVVSGNLKGF